MTEYLLLIALVVSTFGFSRMRKSYFAELSETYHKLMAGQLLWLTALLVNVLHTADFVALVQIAMPTIVVITIQSICLAGGGLLFASGIYDWLTAIAKARDSEARLRLQLEFMSALAGLQKSAATAAAQIESFTPLFSKYLGCRDPLWLNLSFEGVVSDVRGGVLDTDTLSRRVTPYREILVRGNFVYLSDGIGEIQSPVVLLPVGASTNGKTVALLEWPQADLISEQTMSFLHAAVQVLAVAESRPPSALSADAQAALIELRRELCDGEQLDERMLYIYDTLRRVVPFDLLRIAVFDPRGYQLTQHCIGRGRNLISERNKSIASESSDLGRLFAEPVLMFNDNLAASPLPDNRWLHACGVSCALTFPVLHNNQAIAAITLASSEPTLSRRLGEQITDEIVTAIAPLIRVDILNHQLVNLNRQLLDLTGALRVAAQNQQPETLMQELLTMLVRKLPATFCRLWRYDSTRESLSLLCEAASHDVSAQTAALSTVNLDAVRWHHAAVQQGRLVVVNQREEHMRMDDEEVSLTTIAGVQSALIIPVIANARVLGVLTVAELRSWERSHFSLSETLFARGLASVMSHILSRSSDSQRVESLRRQIDQYERRQLVGDIFSDLPTRLATPLTSILARTDHLIGTIASRDENASNNLVAIKRQTEKIVKEIRAIQEVRRSEPATVR